MGNVCNVFWRLKNACGACIVQCFAENSALLGHLLDALC